jgi:hypothetical protein
MTAEILSKDHKQLRHMSWPSSIETKQRWRVERLTVQSYKGDGPGGEVSPS